MVLHCNKPARFAALVLLLISLVGTPSLAGQAYLQEVADMPLPAGFVEDANAGVAFDKPEGRIVEAVAQGRGSVASIIAYYRGTLPELGWSAVGGAAALTWRRDGERLRLEVDENGQAVAVRFHIAPN